MRDKLVSICVPTYEMNGYGKNYLNHSLSILANQTYKNFEVVISDQSENTEIEELCKTWNNKINIKHVYYREGPRKSSSNINNAVKYSSGEIIRILFQDDFLCDNLSLETELVHFLGNHNHWLVTSCYHTKDGVNLINPFHPKYNDEIQYGNNTISSPSVIMIRKDSFLGFDENLFWLMDVEFYKRTYDNFGLPSICNYITVVNREHPNQVSNTLVNEDVKRVEYNYVLDKYKERLQLNNVTLVSVAGVRAQESLNAIKYSRKGIDFAKSILITPEELKDEEIEIIKCEPLDYEKYNHFIVYNLHKYIDTDYAIIIQDDGYIVNPDKWQDEFLEYDYIGAPWPMPQDDYSFKDHFGNLQRVGNGGFTLRSKKLLSLASKLNLEWKSYYGYYNEDGFFCCHNRHIYEKHGCKFADINIASKFSHETPISETIGITPFGFHGKNHPYYKLTQKV